MDYYVWQDQPLQIGDEVYRRAFKPGLPDTLIAEQLLAQTIEVQAGEQALILNCGSGLIGAALARRGAQISLFDDNVVAVEASRRTLALNGFEAVHVYAGDPVLDGSETAADVALPASYDLAVIVVPKGREVGRRLLRQAAQSVKPAGRVYLSGANRAGIKSLIEAAGEIVGPTSIAKIKASHRVALSERSAAPVEAGSDYALHQVQARGQVWRYSSRPGVFAWDRLDEGSRVLIEAMQLDRGDTVLDLGCGSGLVGLIAATLSRRVISVDASAAAVEAARRTYALNQVRNGEARLSDCASSVFDVQFDAVVTNPPFHQGVGTDYQVARQFVLDAARVLKSEGRLWLVANRSLRYEREMVGRFSEVVVAYEDNRYRVLAARK
jgi:16S rRNA (guanine1207-N2)-methyltransferase